MRKYKVLLETIASTVVEVEADDEESAIEAAYKDTPVAAWNWPEIGEWEFPPDSTPSLNTADYIWEAD
ncbi:hypothetical protein NS183_07905 [Microbacterium testaceum]|uniref:hypothetical protein n=1 Tax=Microbacterium testaceum TaxID=2033 RepID=UPI000733DFF1|nr:hypothetical protein [Microbacterium testaceum]KTS90694.1 hypothetical protein NS183_07905 [Microbacterium testaceum]